MLRAGLRAGLGAVPGAVPGAVRGAVPGARPGCVWRGAAAALAPCCVSARWAAALPTARWCTTITDGATRAEAMEARTGRWSEDEDRLLRNAVAQVGSGRGQWADISKLVPGRSAKSCRDHWRECLNTTTGFEPWSPGEDKALDRLVSEVGEGRWTAISAAMEGRSPKECRERWLNHVRPSLSKSPFSAREDETILAMYERMGRRWTLIADVLPGRTSFSVRNRHAFLMKRAGAKDKRKSFPNSRASAPLVWSDEEDQALFDAGQLFPAWPLVADKLKGVKHVTAKECQRRWKEVFTAQDLPAGWWGPDEDARLLAAVQTFGSRWVLVARALGTDYRPTHVQSRYQQLVSGTMAQTSSDCLRQPTQGMRVYWTPDEEAALTKAVVDYVNKYVLRVDEAPYTAETIDLAELQITSGIRWAQAVSDRIPTRTPEQCRLHWHQMRLGSKAGTWSAKEDARLKQAVKRLGEDWEHVAQQVQGRTATHCRYRWTTALSPQLRQDPWTPAEDKLLLREVERQGCKWRLIAKRVKGRQPHALRYRYLVLCKGSRPKLRMWTVNEDEIVRSKNPSQLSDFEAIAKLLPGRTASAVASRWYTMQEQPDDSRLYCRWTADEDEILRSDPLAKTRSWSKLASRLPGRTVAAVRKRFLQLFADQPASLHAENSEEHEFQ